MNTVKGKTQLPPHEASENELTTLFQEAAAPRAEFAKDLKEQVLLQSQVVKPRNDFFSLFMMKLSKPAMPLGVIGAVLLIGAGAFSYDYFSKNSQFANQAEILAQIARANPQKPKANTEATTLATGADAKIGASYMFALENRNFTYRKTTNENVLGAAADRCSPLITFNKEVTREVYSEFYANKTDPFSTYYQSVSYAGDTIFDYTLNRGSEQWQYRGGSYAVHMNDLQKIRPMLLQTDDQIQANTGAEISRPGVVTPFFGDGAKIVGKETRNGKGVYKIVLVTHVSCSNPPKTVGGIRPEEEIYIIQQSTTPATYITYADVNTYAIVQEEMYIGTVTTRNLVYRKSTTEQTSMTGLTSEVEKEFTFNLNVSQKTVDASQENYEKGYRTSIVDYLNAKGGYVLVLSGDRPLMSASSPYVTYVPDTGKHLIDRAFYSNTPAGQALFDDNKDMYKQTLEPNRVYPFLTLTYSYSGTTQDKITSISVSETNARLKGLAALEAFGSSMNMKANGTATLTIGGRKLVAEVFESFFEGTSEPGSDGSSDNLAENGAQPMPPIKGEPLYKEMVLVFRNGDVTSVVTVGMEYSMMKAELAKLLNFEEVSTTDTTRLDKELTTALQQLQVLY